MKRVIEIWLRKQIPGSSLTSLHIAYLESGHEMLIQGKENEEIPGGMPDPVGVILPS